MAGQAPFGDDHARHACKYISILWDHLLYANGTKRHKFSYVPIQADLLAVSAHVQVQITNCINPCTYLQHLVKSSYKAFTLFLSPAPLGHNLYDRDLLVINGLQNLTCGNNKLLCLESGSKQMRTCILNDRKESYKAKLENDEERMLTSMPQPTYSVQISDLSKVISTIVAACSYLFLIWGSCAS